MAVNEGNSPFADGAAVKAILIDSTLTAVQLSPFVKAADLVVRNNLINSELSEETMVEIAAWLAAHFATIGADRPVKSESVAGEYSVTYETGMLGKGLESTIYGQTALALDTSGRLKGINMKRARVKTIDHNAIDTTD